MVVYQSHCDDDDDNVGCLSVSHCDNDGCLSSHDYDDGCLSMSHYEGDGRLSLSDHEDSDGYLSVSL